MKKSFLTIPLFFLCCWFCGDAQTPDWVWARSVPSSMAGSGTGCSIAMDKSNNLYITGFYSDTITFGSTNLITTNNPTFYLAKYDSSGNVLWAKSAINSVNGWSWVYHINTDIFGNEYIIGYFTDTVSFGPYTLTSAGLDDIFLVKYDSSGIVLWAKSAGGTATDYGIGVSTDNLGNVYITGGFKSSSITFGSYALTNSGNTNIFIAKYDSSGNVLWAKRAGGNHLDSGNDIATDALANVYVTGWLASASVIFGTDTLTNTGFSNVFLAKYDSSGHVIWVTRSMGTDRDEGMYVAADSSGNVYLTGTYESPIITFGSYPLFNAGNADAFLAKYDSSGNVRWAKSIGGSALDWGYCVSIANSTKIYITGWFDSTLLNFDSIIVPRPNFGHDPMYFAGYDSSGQVLFAKGLGSGGYNNNAVAASPTGCIYIVGGFQGINPFKLGNDSLVLSGQEDIFVAKLCYSGLTAGFISSSSIFCAAPVQCINFYDDSYGNPTSWHWSFTGATPDTSSLQNPDSICYSIAGSYPVSLIVSNGTLTDTLTVASMIIVGNPPLPPTITVVGGDTLYSSHGLWYQWFLNGMYIFGAYDSFYVALQGGTYSVQITDQYGCQSQSAGIQVGIDELSGGVGVAVYPNPFNDELVASPRSALGGRGEWEFTLFDVTSRVLFHRLFTNQTTINTEQLARGIYFYEVRDKNGAKEMGKVVKE